MTKSVKTTQTTSQELVPVSSTGSASNLTTVFVIIQGYKDCYDHSAQIKKIHFKRDYRMLFKKPNKSAIYELPLHKFKNYQSELKTWISLMSKIPKQDRFAYADFNAHAVYDAAAAKYISISLPDGEAAHLERRTMRLQNRLNAEKIDKSVTKKQ